MAELLFSILGNELIDKPNGIGSKNNTVRLKVKVGDKIEHVASENINFAAAFECALRKALVKHYPEEISELKIVNYHPVIVNIFSEQIAVFAETHVSVCFNGLIRHFRSEYDPDFYRSACVAIAMAYEQSLKEMSR